MAAAAVRFRSELEREGAMSKRTIYRGYQITCEEVRPDAWSAMAEIDGQVAAKTSNAPTQDAATHEMRMAIDALENA